MRWLAPTGGETLRAGGVLEVAWEPGERFAEMRSVEEWELFLSYDGGVSWPVRLTPHLDAAMRRYRARLPALAADEVRLLLRLGDEREEYEAVLSATLRIEPSAEPASAPSQLPWSRVRGESPRAGHPGVTLWSEGWRAGDGARWVTAPMRHATLGGSRLAAWGDPPVATLTHRPPRLAAVGAARGPIALPTLPVASGSVSTAVPPARRPPLSQTCRRNE